MVFWTPNAWLMALTDWVERPSETLWRSCLPEATAMTESNFTPATRTRVPVRYPAGWEAKESS